MDENNPSITINMEDAGGTAPTESSVPPMTEPLDPALLINMLASRPSPPRIPKFMEYAVDLWHQQNEAVFAIHKIYDQKTKYFQVLASLEPHVLEKITAYVASPMAGNEYLGLKDALSFAFDKSDGDKFHMLFDMTLGNQKPSQLYYAIRRLWLDENPDQSKMLRHIFMTKLPSSVAVGLRSCQNFSLHDFLKAADAMADQHRQSESQSCIREVMKIGVQKEESAQPATFVNARTSADKSKYIDTKKFQKKHEPFNAEMICDFHQKWGQKSFKCRPGCKYIHTKSLSISTTFYAVDDINLPSSNNAKTFHLKQEVHGKPIIVDTGSSFSLLPAQPHEKKTKPNYSLFKDAQGTPIPVYGQKQLEVDIGELQKIIHTFYIAGVQDPLLGMDFLWKHRLLVDPVHKRLLNVDAIHAPNPMLICSTQETTNEFNDLWQEYPELCNSSVERLSAVPKHDIEHDIELKQGTKPFSFKARRLFGDKLDAAKNEFDTMLKLGIIRRSKSSWASPLHIVPKGDGTFRPCGDFRRLNAVTVPDRYPLPHIQDFSRDLLGSKWFSKIDLVRAFHQIPLSKDAIPKTALITPMGLFEFCRMPFGLCNAAQSFQRFMDNVTRGLEGIYVYIDDILVTASSKEEMKERLRQLFERLCTYGLIVNPKKSVLGVQEVTFLGFAVSTNGIKPDQSKVAAITNFPSPTTFGKLSEFLGIVNFYHRFIPKCSVIARPLYDILKEHNRKKCSKKPIPISAWKKPQEISFQELKEAVRQCAALTFPDPQAETRLVTDASDIAAGAVLEQLIHNEWKPIGFYSKMFSSAELKYCAYDRELLAIKLALQHFRHIVEGLPSDLFHVATDHKPLTTGKNFLCARQNKTQSDRVERTWQFISQFTTNIKHIPGRENPVADALSRNAVNSCRPNMFKMIAEEQENVGMRPGTNDPWPQHWEIQKHYDTEVAVDTRASLPRLIVPPNLTKAVFDSVHSINHPGSKATKKAVGKFYIWPGLATDVSQWCKECPNCQASKVIKHNKTPFTAFQEPSYKFQAIHIDIVGPLPCSNGYSYLLTVVDRFSRWPVAVPMRNITAEECAKALVTGWIQYYGVPSSIVTDRGRQFTSSLWENLCQVLDSVHNTTTAYHPQSNGLVERFHRQLKTSLMSKLDKNEQWYDNLPIVMLGIRTSVKEDLQVSSADILYGQPIVLPGSFFPDLTGNGRNTLATHEYVNELQKSMADFAYVKPNWHGHNVPSQQLQDLNSCSHVYVLVSSVKSPLQRPYRGPFKVESRSEKSFSIRLPNGSLDTISTDRLKPAHIQSPN